MMVRTVQNVGWWMAPDSSATIRTGWRRQPIMNIVPPTAVICQFRVVDVAGYCIITTQRNVFQEGTHQNYNGASWNFSVICDRIRNISCGHVLLQKMFCHSESNFRLLFASLSICLLNRSGNAVTDSSYLITGPFLWIRMWNYGYCIWGACGEIPCSFIEIWILYDFSAKVE
jgi:hypothetical protein